MPEFLVGLLATWRLTALLVSEKGPFDLLGKFRDAVGIRYDEHSHPYGRNEVAQALTCFWCTSFWLGLAVSALQGHVLIDGFLIGFAYSGGAILLERMAAK